MTCGPSLVSGKRLAHLRRDVPARGWRDEDHDRLRNLDIRLSQAIEGARLVVGSREGDNALHPLRAALLRLLPSGHTVPDRNTADEAVLTSPVDGKLLVLRFQQRQELMLAPIALIGRAPGDRRPAWWVRRQWELYLRRFG